MFYFVTTHWWLKLLYPHCIWDIKTDKKIIYLTFDDGPHFKATDYVLSELNKFNAKATFFCIGKNVNEHFDIYKKIIEDGHAVGNHTYNHLSGWKTKDKIYLDDIFETKKIVDSNLFRPPYGRVTKFQINCLKQEKYNLKTIMWSVLSGDFDINLSNEDCYLNVVNNAKQGSVIVFHDSEKAFEKVKYTLPKVLQYFTDKGYSFEKILV